MFKQYLTTTTLLLIACSFLFGQSQTPLDITLRYLEHQKQDLGLSSDDLADWVVTDQYKSDHNGVTHTYLIQRHKGIKLYNAMITSNVGQDGKMVHLANRFVGDKRNKINTLTNSISAQMAVNKVAAHLQVPLPAVLEIKDPLHDNKISFKKNNVALEPITAELVYFPINDGSLILAWDIFFYLLDGQNAWSIKLDANSGEILDKKDRVIKCNFSHPEHDECTKYQHRVRPDVGQNYAHTTKAVVSASNFGHQNAAPNTYTVVPFPIESPTHGAFDMVTTTGDPVASPFGWHSSNAASWTFTRGNNVHAYQDRNGNNSSSNDEPDGGATLEFDFPFNQSAEPDTYVDAATVNLFYAVNYVHDLFYHYGFNEAAGNFQSNNNGNGGFGNDHVIAESQDNADGATPDRNNANFFTPNDGSSGRMQMFLWDSEGADPPLFTANSPASIAGAYPVGTAEFGAPIGPVAITADIVLVDDGTGTVSDACEPIVNGAAITGKIAMIDRGDCEFGFKILEAEQKGAIAAIMCNNVQGEGSNFLMLAGAVGGSVTIPSVFMTYEDCIILKTEMNAGPVNATLQDNSAAGPADYDADFDNGIIAHEYGHGISRRLTGGPSTTNCLDNDEDPGEGWSDLIALFSTVKPGDMGADPRAIGTYVERTSPTGGGIRRFPYSTDWTVNSQTYDDIRGTVGGAPHPVGEVIVAVMWDLFWNLVDEYGFDADIQTGTGGNNIAIQLYIDGLKMQACNPGFVDYRDAVLAADNANNGGANQCIIWKTFARRGLGVDADQGSTASRNDGTPSFDPPADCIIELKIVKTATPSVDVADDITYSLHVINDKATPVTGTVVTDDVPTGTSYVTGSATMGGTLSGNTITWNLGTLAADEEVMLEFKVNPNDANYTTIVFEDGFENGAGNWIASHDNMLGTNDWFLDNGNPATGSFAAFAEDPAAEADQYFQTVGFYQLNTTRPALIFDHFYDTERSFDGGIVEFLDANFEWNNLGPDMVRNGYPEPIQNGLVPAGDGAFSGNSGAYVETVVDLSTNYLNQEGFFRMRMISDDNTAANGWYVDNFKVVDLFTIQGADACVTTTEGDNVCAPTPDIGTIIYGNSLSPNNNVNTPDFEVKVFPNPAKDFISINIISDKVESVEVSIISVDGRLVDARTSTDNIINFDISGLSAGVYLAKVKTKDGIVTEKIVVE